MKDVHIFLDRGVQGENKPTVHQTKDLMTSLVILDSPAVESHSLTHTHAHTHTHTHTRTHTHDHQETLAQAKLNNFLN